MSNQWGEWWKIQIHEFSKLIQQVQNVGLPGQSREPQIHYNDAIMGAVASQITSLTIVYSTENSDADQRKHQSSVSLDFVRVIHRRPVNSPHKWPVMRKMFPFDDVIISCEHGDGYKYKELLDGNRNGVSVKCNSIHRWLLAFCWSGLHLHFDLNYTDPAWLSLTNERKFVD